MVVAGAGTPTTSKADILRTGAARRLRELPGGTAVLEHLKGRLQSRRSHSQFGEDLHLRTYYDRLAYERGVTVSGGCVVDIGAFRPIVHSNSYLFHRLGWRCVNIDPTPGFRRRFDQVRPSDVNLEIGIAPEVGRATFFLFGTPSVWNTLDAASAAHAVRITGVTPRQIPVTLSRLDTVLDQHLGGHPFEILLVDAEGYDVEILRSGDFSRHRPRVVLIEVAGVSAGTLAANPVVRFLEPHGYTLHSWINPNLMLVREDSTL